MRNPKVALASLLVIAVITFAGCQFRPSLLSAVAYNDNQDVVVQIKLRTPDARIIENREFYFYPKIINCNGTGNAFPALPPVEGGRISGFDPRTQSESVQINVRVPAHIFTEYTQPCVFLEGGGYLTGTIKSSMTPILHHQGAGPN